MDDALSWAATSSRVDRLDFFKALCNCIKEDEVKAAKNLLTNAIKKKKRMQATAGAQKFAPVPDTTGPLPMVSAPASNSGGSSRQQVDNFMVGPWWKCGYKPSAFVSLDCEMVSLNDKDPLTGKHIMRAATVSVKDFQKRVVYSAQVKHEPGTFIVNKHTQKVNGFGHDSLKDGDDFRNVTNDIAELLKGKVVVGSGCESDFRCLDLVISDYDVFNLGDHWKKWTGQMTKLGRKVYQEIGLRSLYHHYYGIDLHDGVHSAEKDADATMDLFHKYISIKTNNLSSRLHDNYDEFDCIKILKN